MQQTPYFIFKPKILTQNYLEFETLCQRHLQNFKICYSVKTNSFPGVIKTLNKLGSGFEVASLNEINIVPKNFVVFNGPAKTYEELKIAIKKRFLINVDSKSELEKLATILNGKPTEVSIRISLKDSKFGFDESQLNSIIEYAKSGNIFITGIHFHSGTQINLPEYKANLDKISIIIYFLEKKSIRLKYIDIGGGFPDKFQLKNLNLSLENYLSAISQFLSRFNATIILEPGRNLICDVFKLITKVNVIKENFGRTYAILDAGINLLPKITLSTYRFSKIPKPERFWKNREKSENTKDFSRVINKPDKETNQQKREYVLAGPLLFSNDILGKFIGNLKEGDLIKIENVGAYCYNLAWELSYKKPKIFIEK